MLFALDVCTRSEAPNELCSRHRPSLQRRTGSAVSKIWRCLTQCDYLGVWLAGGKDVQSGGGMLHRNPYGSCHREGNTFNYESIFCVVVQPRGVALSASCYLRGSAEGGGVCVRVRRFMQVLNVLILEHGTRVCVCFLRWRTAEIAKDALFRTLMPQRIIVVVVMMLISVLLC